jgi:hypothetical protein
MSLQPLLSDELLDQVLEDERAAALQEFRERDEPAEDFISPFTDIT